MIIVTGGAGFIGSNLIRGLNQRGVTDILVVDNLTHGAKHLNLNALRFHDYLDKDDLLRELPALGRVEAIFHQGACTSTTEPDGRYMMRNNFEFSKRLLDFAIGQAVPFLYASSAAVYGDGEQGFREERRCEYPLNVYGFSKLAFDNHVRHRLGAASSPIVGLRYFNVYGPQENHKGRMASVARHLYRQLVVGDEMQLFAGSDRFRRDFVHVDDVVGVNLHFLDHGGHGIYNCGTGTARSFAAIARVLSTLHGRGEIRYIAFPDDLQGKYQEFTEADLTTLRAAGCDHPFVTLEEGLARYLAILDAAGGYHR